MNFRSIAACCSLVLPLVLFGQTSPGESENIQKKIDELSRIIDQLKAEQSLSGDIENILEEHSKGFTVRDSMRLVSLKRKQEASRARIDALTLEIIRVSKQLEDPRKRFALAKRMKEEKIAKTRTATKQAPKGVAALDTISTQSIDLEAVKLVREGKTLDQARLLVIDGLTQEQVLNFYRTRSKAERYTLYDISDNIIRTQGAKEADARRSAIYFHLYTKK